MKPYVLRAALATVLAAAASSAAAEVVDFRGFYKHLLSAQDVGDSYKNIGLTDEDTAFDSFQRLRLEADARPNDALQFTAHYELRAAWGEFVRISNTQGGGVPTAGIVPGIGATTARPRFLDLDSDLVDESEFTLAHGLDRLFARWWGESMSVTVGRQAVSWGAGLIWTPSDLFVGFAPTEIDRDQKLGVDVVRWTWNPSLALSIDVIGEPLDVDEPYEINPDDSSLAGRATAHVGEYEISALGGIIAGDGVVGGDWTGYLKDAGFRGEWTYTRVQESDERDYFLGVLSVDYGFAARWNPYVAVEYFYNGLGTSDPDGYLDRLAEDSVQRAFSRGTAFNIGRNYIGSVIGLTPTTLFSLGATTLWNLEDGSVREFATATWSLAENVDFQLGMNVGLGRIGTEFVGFSAEQAGVESRNPNLYYAYLKFYF